MTFVKATRSTSFPAIAVLALLVLGTGFQGESRAADIDVSCSDVSDAGTCTLNGVGSFTSDLFDNINDVLGTLQSGQAQGGCTLLEVDSGGVVGTNLYGCTVREGERVTARLECRIDRDSATCDYQNRPELIDVSCARDGTGGGTCNISTSAEAIGELGARIGVPVPLRPFADALIAGCASFAGAPAVRRDCAVLLDELTAPDGEVRSVVNTVMEVAPLNADAALYSTQLTLNSRLAHTFTRLSRLRSRATADRGVDTQGLQVFDLRGFRVPALAVSSSGEDAPRPAPDTGGASARLGVFLSGALLDTEALDVEFENGSRGDSQLLTWGFDYRLGPSWVAGLVFSGASTEVGYNEDRGNLEDLGLLLAAYAGYFRNNVYVDVTLGVGGNDYDQVRRIRCAAQECGFDIEQSATSRFSGYQTAFALAGGYDFVRGGLSLTPYLQLIASSIVIDDYLETASDPEAPGAGFVYDLDRQVRTSAQLSIGARATYALGTALGVVVPEGGLELVTDLNQDDLVVEGQFIGNVSRDDNFRLETRAVDENYLVASGGAQLLLSNGRSVYWNGRYLIDSDRVELFEFTAGIRFELP